MRWYLFVILFAWATPGFGQSLIEFNNVSDSWQRLVALEMLGDEYLHAFDKALARDENPLLTPEYQRLWILRTHKNTTLEELADQWEDSVKLNLFLPFAQTSKDYQLLRQVLGVPKNISKPLRNASDLIVEELRSRMEATGYAEKYGSLLNAPVIFNRVEKYDLMIKDAIELVPVLREDIEQQEKFLELHNTTSNSYCPSPGSDGNITGNSFPQNVWSLTYDDGPHSSRTPQILNLLNEAGIKATFFVVAKNAKIFGSAMDRALAAGSEIANHSYTHANLPKISGSGQDREIFQSTKDIEALISPPLKFFRLPYGSGVRNHSRVRTKIAQAGLVHVFWNVDSLDWQDRNPASVLHRVMKQMAQRGRGVILFHDIHSQTVRATELLLQKLPQNPHWKFRLLNEAGKVLKFCDQVS